MNKGTSVWVARWIIKEDKEGNPIKGDEGQPIGYWKWMGKVVPLAEIRTLDGKPVDITMIDYEKKTLVDAAPELIELARQEYAMKKLLEGDEGECL